MWVHDTYSTHGSQTQHTLESDTQQRMGLGDTATKDDFDTIHTRVRYSRHVHVNQTQWSLTQQHMGVWHLHFTATQGSQGHSNKGGIWHRTHMNQTLTACTCESNIATHGSPTLQQHMGVSTQESDTCGMCMQVKHLQHMEVLTLQQHDHQRQSNKGGIWYRTYKSDTLSIHVQIKHLQHMGAWHLTATRGSQGHSNKGGIRHRTHTSHIQHAHVNQTLTPTHRVLMPTATQGSRGHSS